MTFLGAVFGLAAAALAVAGNSRIWHERYALRSVAVILAGFAIGSAAARNADLISPTFRFIVSPRVLAQIVVLAILALWTYSLWFPTASDIEGYQERAKGLMADGAYDDALRELRFAQQLDPATVATYLLQAIAYGNKNTPQMAEACIQGALRRRPDSSDAHIALGTLYLGRRDLMGALRQAQLAIEWNPISADAIRFRALILAELGDSATGDLHLFHFLNCLGSQKSQVVDPTDIPSFLSTLELDDSWLVVHLAEFATGNDRGLRVWLCTGQKDDEPFDCRSDVISTIVRSRDAWRPIEQFLLNNSQALDQYSSNQCPKVLNVGRKLQTLLYRLPKACTLPLGANGCSQLVLTSETQRHLALRESTTYPASHYIVIIEEPHGSSSMQFEMYRGLAKLFASNAFLANASDVVFLCEGWPANVAIDLAPLVRAEPVPSEIMIRAVLESFLIPGQLAFLWRHGPGNRAIGHEDSGLYRVCASHLAEPLADGRLWTNAVAARNHAMFETVQGEIRDGTRFPFLCLGGLHLSPLKAGEHLADADYQRLCEQAPHLNVRAVQHARKDGVSDYLKAAGIGYHFLTSRHSPFHGMGVTSGDMVRYKELFRAQTQDAVADYVRRYVECLNGTVTATTTAPDVAAAASLVRSLTHLPLRASEDSTVSQMLQIQLQAGASVFGDPPGRPSHPLSTEQPSRFNPNTIHFTQHTCSSFFDDGSRVDDLVEQLRKGKSVDTVPSIQVLEHDGRVFSLDNRRLLAFIVAGVDSVPVEWVSLADEDIAERFWDRFSPIDGTGEVIVVARAQRAKPYVERERTKAIHTLLEWGKIRPDV